MQNAIPSSVPTSQQTAFEQHASSLVRHFASLLQNLPLPILDPMQPSQPAQSSPSKRRHSSAQLSQTQAGASATVPLQPTTNASKRSKKNPAVSTGHGTDGTPPAEENWWADRKIDWENDCGGEDQQPSFAYFKDWIPTGISYMSGAVGGYTLKRGAKEFQRFLYEKKGPTKRSVKSIENKVSCPWIVYNEAPSLSIPHAQRINIHIVYLCEKGLENCL